MPSMMYDAFRQSAIGDVTGFLLYRDTPPLRKRHRRLLRRAVGRRQARVGWAMLTRSNIIAWFDGDPRDRVTVQLVVDSGGIIKVEEDA